jgi:hypothetical protein
MGARWTWNTLADNACSHHIPSLAPAVALPAPRHDRRRTGAAGSPPGGFPFVEFRRAVVKCAAARGEPRSDSVFIGGAQNPLIRAPACARVNSSGKPGPRSDWVPRDASVAGCPSRGRAEGGILRHTEQIDTRPRGPSLDSGNPLCYRTEPLRGLCRRHSGRIAQLVEQLTLNQRVPGSSPGAPTIDPVELFARLHQNITERFESRFESWVAFAFSFVVSVVSPNPFAVACRY